MASLSKALLMYHMNDLCIELQKRYECVVDLVEKNTTEIWDYEANLDDFNVSGFQNVSFTSSSSTDFAKLGINPKSLLSQI